MNMNSHCSVFLLGALGVLSTAAQAVDTSQWKCETCPYPKGTSGSVDVGVIGVDDASTSYGNYTGLQRRGAYGLLGGTLRQRSDDGYYADAEASDLGIDTRSLSARAGREGLYSLRLGYAEIPRYLTEGAVTPYLGVGGANLTLGTPATLQPVDVGYKYRRLDAGGTLIGPQAWTVSIDVRHDARDGTKPTSGSFYSSAAQLPAPVNQQTDQLEVAASYARNGLQARFAYQLSLFRNDDASLLWANPFPPVVAGATVGQLALAPNNQFHQLSASGGYDLTPDVRISAQVAVGRSTQDAAYLPSTQNASLSTTLPVQSLDGQVDTFNASARITANLTPDLKVHGAYIRNVRDNRTSINTYTQVDTDMFVSGTRDNTPFSFWQDRFEVGADYRAPGKTRLSGGVEQNDVQRSFSPVVTTRDTTVWGRINGQLADNVGMSLKLAHADSNNSPYGTATWFGSPDNPLQRNYNLADRTRNSAQWRTDLNFTERIALGWTLDAANDSYSQTQVGLTSARKAGAGVDVSIGLSERTQLTGYAQYEETRSEQNGSQQFGAPDWTGKTRDQVSVWGLSLRHAVVPDKFDVGGDFTSTRGRSDTLTQTTSSDPPFPTARTSMDSLRVFGTYKLKDNVWLNGSLAHEHLTTQDWRLDGVLPTTVSNLLAFGAVAPHYNVNVLRLSMRYAF